MKERSKIALLLFFLLTSFGIISCGQEKTEEKSEVTQEVQENKYPEAAKDYSIYEVNIRQYTPEGTFNAFLPHMDRLKEMGVDILWFMPIQPIGIENRKGPEEGSLGSYYSIRDYTAVNQNFGTLEDFRKIVDRAHELDMIVILDWVANHTAFDHHWTKEHPDFYNRDDEGNLIPPMGTDWTDVADLNYENKKLHEAMRDEMAWWIKEADIDGFRCDVAHEVPMAFWNPAVDSLQKIKDLFMLAESDVPMMHDSAFHMTYGWGFHALSNQIAEGDKKASDIGPFLKEDREKYGEEAFRMNFTSNHDENSWNGTVFERYGDGTKTFAVLMSTVQGMPLIYSGQEAALDERLEFFVKDTIEWGNYQFEDFYTKLLKLKRENPALYNGEFGAPAEPVDLGNENVFAFKRSKDDNTVSVILNLSKDPQSVNVPEEWVGTQKEYMSGEEVELAADQSLDPWVYYIFVTNEN
ncbi:alpha-amylase family glycosyl hydrolase [Mangrovivirga sp. M17]|uniref:Alpha-amylase family glycosyl hydrolase n=1 Tax=Mangrovivirga halotolerans TaxID=2993936 RepID=A0ABT3RS09_9BACT|nr:alpha-amylase family glycosyl hydrolase [Mangrovivirga halotolerans]MCX2744357.1 alpha-amylase family glycosyl hydrolase [Mangrovivirga halotolerans]